MSIMSGSGAEIGPNDIIIHLVNPYKCLDCGTEFYHKNSFLQHLVEHMDNLKSQHPCYQIVCGVNLAAQQPNSITVTKDILQINENQMFELQDTSVDYTQLPPLKTLEQAGILRLPAPGKVLPPAPVLPKLQSSQPLAINFASTQPPILQGVMQQSISFVQGHASNSRLSILGKSCDGKQLGPHNDLSDIQNLQATDSSPELQTLVNQALMESSGIKEEYDGEIVDITNNVHMQESTESLGHFNTLGKVNVTKGLDSWNNGHLRHEMKHIMVFKEMPDAIAEINDNRVQCKICFSRFASKNMLMRHQVIHSGDKPHCCFKCFKQFNDITSLAKHIKIHKRSHQCPVCLKMFLRRRQMELHLGQHKKKRFIQFGHKYHEVQVSTSRNACGQIVHEYSLSVLLKKNSNHTESSAGGSNIHEKEGACENQAQENTTDGDSCQKKLNGMHQSNTLPAEKVFPFQNIPESVSLGDLGNDPMIDKQHHSLSMYKVIYRCGHCKKCISTRPTLSRHLMLHTNEKPFRCEVCGKHFRHKSDLVHHSKTHTKPVKCLTCGSAFSKELYLQNHLQKGCPFLESDNEKFIVLPDLKYQCNLCNKVLKTKANIVRHLRIHAFNSKVSDSKKISKNFNDTRDTVKPDIGNDTLSDNVDDYIKPLEYSVGFQCTLCEETFRFRSFILIHVRMHLGQRSFKCKKCGKGFYGRYMLRKHQQNHIKPYKCPKCGKGFNRRYIMAHHFKKSHNAEAEDKLKDITFHPNEKEISCDICGKTMPSYQKSVMQYHIRLHKDVRPYQCKVCDKNFISEIALKKHSLNHSRPYTCQVCNKGFSRRYLMLDHFAKRCKRNMKKQENLKTVQKENTAKPLDDEQVRNLNSLEESQQTTSDKPYQVDIITELDEAKGIKIFKCSPCDKAFILRDALSRHIKRFMKPTSCKYCKTVFEDKHLTLAHQRSCLGVDTKSNSPEKLVQTVGEKQEKVLKTMKEMKSKIESLTVSQTKNCEDEDTLVNEERLEGKESTSTLNDASTIYSATQSNLKTVVSRTISVLKEGCVYPCPNCEKTFGTPRGLKIHAASHVRLYKCDVCGQDFTQVRKFRHHLKSHYKNEDENGEEVEDEFDMDKSNEPSQEQMEDAIGDCSTKVLKLSTKEVGVKNINEMDSTDNFVEEKCVTANISNVSLRLLQSGTRGRPYSCQMCRRRFTEESGLQLHLSHYIHGVK